MAGNIGGNYVVRFHGKIIGLFLEELNLHLDCIHSATPTRASSSPTQSTWHLRVGVRIIVCYKNWQKLNCAFFVSTAKLIFRQY